METLPTKTVYKVENYPYGHTLKTDKFYSIEFTAKRGFRLVEQTLNPKTGKLNAPKKSTYSPVMLLRVENGKIRAHTEDFYDDAGKSRGYKFMFENHHNFSVEEIKAVALYNIMLLKADIIAKATYCGSDTAKMFPLYEEAVKTLVEISKTGENLWNKININWEEVKALEVPDYKPFKASSYSNQL